MLLSNLSVNQSISWYCEKKANSKQKMKWNWNWNSNWFVINMIQFMRSAIGRSTVAGKISITIQNYETVSFSRRKKDLVAVFSHVKIDRFVSDGLDQFGVWLISTSRYSSGCLYLENVTQVATWYDCEAQNHFQKCIVVSSISENQKYANDAWAECISFTYHFRFAVDSV